MRSRITLPLLDMMAPLTFDEVSAWGHQGKNGVTVEAMTLETLVVRNNLDRVDFIKLDVEGGEFPVLKSSLDLINRFETLVHVELNSLTLLVWGNTNPREFVQCTSESFLTGIQLPITNRLSLFTAS